MDRRQQKTRKAIFEAFQTLLSQKKYSRITVQDIIDTANIGRTTFYDHFETKDALLNELCNNLFEHVFSDHPDLESNHNFSFSHGNARTVITHILYHIRDNRETIALLSGGESGELFSFYFRQYLDRTVIQYLLDKLVTGNLNVPEDFLRHHISCSFMAMIQWWIHNGLAETPEQMADHFLSVIEPVLA